MEPAYLEIKAERLYNCSGFLNFEESFLERGLLEQRKTRCSLAYTSPTERDLFIDKERIIVNCPMKADEAKWFRLITAKRQQELQGKIREEFNERLTDIIRRGGNLGYRRGSEIEFATKRLVANERAKLDAMKEVLATSGAILTEDLGKWLLHADSYVF